MPKNKKNVVKGCKMIERDINNKINQSLNKFEKLAGMQPDEDWSVQLMDKLDNLKPGRETGISLYKNAIVIIFLVLINIGFVFISLSLKSSEPSYNMKDMQVISRELLINPTSINN